jgi:2-methylisocitrate lyase-like PEP mutase family enzyme
LSFKFTLTARAENLLHGQGDLGDTIARLQAFAAAGADVVYAPGLRSLDDIRAVVRSVSPVPVNVVMGLSGASWTVEQLARAGVHRISVGSAMARTAYGALLCAAREMLDHGSFGFAAHAVPFNTLNASFGS